MTMSAIKRLNDSFVLRLLLLTLVIICCVEVLKLIHRPSVKLQSVMILDKSYMLKGHDTSHSEMSSVLLLNVSGRSITWEKKTTADVKLVEAHQTSVHRHTTRSYPLPVSLYSLILSKTRLFNESHIPNFNHSGSSFGKFRRLSLMEDIFKSGFGLQPYITEKGESGWIENGVVYRPSENKNKTDGEQDVFRSGFEAFVPFVSKLFFQGDDTNESLSTDDREKKIILWHSKARYVPTMSGLHPLQKCPDFPCALTTNLKYAAASAAMVFSGQRIRGSPPKRSSSNQIFVFHNQEPPLAKFFRRPFFKRKPWKGIFNWTMSYRLDSDIVSLYGILRKRPSPAQKNYTAILSRKKRLVAWMVSHCDSPGKRQEYVEELRKYVPVDIYGGCGNLTCDRSMNDKCSEMIAGKYKFYLSFENGICPDYVTEKFFRYMSTDMVTVARGSNCYWQHAPSDIFLNTADFQSPKQLAKTILRLDGNDDEYVDMLKEKDKYMQIYEDYEIEDGEGVVTFTHYHHEAVAFCEMCQKLWNLEKNTKVISDIGAWFDRKLCHDPTDLNFQ